MSELVPGIYEQLITEGLRAQLDQLADHTPVDVRPLNSADASDRVAWHVSRQVERALLGAGAYSHALPAAAMPAWYHGLDVLLHPSFDAEGFPLPPLEASMRSDGAFE